MRETGCSCTHGLSTSMHKHWDPKPESSSNYFINPMDRAQPNRGQYSHWLPLAGKELSLQLHSGCSGFTSYFPDFQGAAILLKSMGTASPEHLWKSAYTVYIVTLVLLFAFPIQHTFPAHMSMGTIKTCRSTGSQNDQGTWRIFHHLKSVNQDRNTF